MSYIRVKVTGGLGNQLFKTLVGISFAKEFKSGLVLDTSWYNKKRKKSDPVNPRKFEIDAFPELRKEFEIHARVNPSVLDDRIGQLLRRVDDKISTKFNYITDSNYSGIRLGKKHYVLDGNFELEKIDINLIFKEWYDKFSFDAIPEDENPLTNLSVEQRKEHYKKFALTKEPKLNLKTLNDSITKNPNIFKTLLIDGGGRKRKSIKRKSRKRKSIKRKRHRSKKINMDRRKI